MQLDVSYDGVFMQFAVLTIQGFLNDPINRYPYLLIGVGDPINRGTFFVKLYFLRFL